jgi:glutamate synthase domain-containing protein 3
MTGGVIYVQDRDGMLERRINSASVRIEALDPDEDADELRDLVIAHFRYTGSMRADEIITDLNSALRSFKKIVPHEL